MQEDDWERVDGVSVERRRTMRGVRERMFV